MPALPGPIMRTISAYRRPIGAALGGATGYAATPEGQDPLLHTVGGAVAGGVVLPGFFHAAGFLGGPKGPLADRFINASYFSMLGSVDTMAKGAFGAIGGATKGALELVLEGLLKGDSKLIGRGGDVVKALVTESPKIWWKGLKSDPAEYAKLYQHATGNLRPEALSRVGEGLRQFGAPGISRFFSSPDMAAVYALRQGGFTGAEAARYTLAGEPISKWGSEALKGLRSFQDPKRSQLTRLTGHLAAPFARVPIVAAEKGLQRIPGIGSITNYMMRGTAPQPGVYKQAAQQLLGYGAYKAGEHFSEYLDPRLAAVIGPLAGPGYLPFWYGTMKGRVESEGTSGFFPVVSAALTRTLAEANPMGFRPLGAILDPLRELPRKLIPSGLADIASALDPAYGRELGKQATTAQWLRGETTKEQSLGDFGRQLTARLPLFREHLPERFAPVDIFGRPRFRAPEATATDLPVQLPSTEGRPLYRGIMRAFAPSSRMWEPPAMDSDDPLVKQLRALGLENLQAPTGSISTPGTGMPMVQTREGIAAVRRQQGVRREVAAKMLVQFKGLETAPDTPEKRLVVRTLWNQINELVRKQPQILTDRELAYLHGARPPKVRAIP
jgi:hypothetical protein